MPQINATVTSDIVDSLQEIAQKTNKSFSRIVSDMVELGLKVYEKQNDSEAQKLQSKLRELEEKHSEFLLRLLNINSEILRKLYDEKPKFDGKNTDEILGKIKDNVRKYIEGYLGANL